MHDHLIDISINSPLWGQHENIESIVTEAIGIAICEGLTYLNKKALTAEISLVLSDNDFIQDLNKTYRQQDKPTNVLSFPQTEIDEFDGAQDQLSLGDIIIAYNVIAKESEEQKKDFNDHLRHMLVHGTLHLMHFDHIHEEEAEEMEALEIEILSKMNIKNPYEI